MKLPIARISIIAASALAAGFAAAPAMAETECRIDGGAVYFSHQGASLSDESRAALNRIAAEARACKAASVLVRTGAGELAEQRATAIAQTLAANGVSVTRTVTSPTAMAANEGFIQARVAEIEIRAPGQSVS